MSRRRPEFAASTYPLPPRGGGGDATAGLSTLVYQEGGTAAAPNQFTSWTALYEAFLKTHGPVKVAIDTTFAPAHIATIDVGTWDFQGRAGLVTSGLNTDGGAALAIPDGSVLQNLTSMGDTGGDLQLNTASSVVSPLQWTGTPLAQFTVSDSAAFLQRGAAPVIRVAAGQTFYLLLDDQINFNAFPGGFGALVDLPDATSSLALESTRGLNLFLGPPGNFISGVVGSQIFYAYDAGWPGNPANSSFFGTYTAPFVIDQASSMAYVAVPGDWVAPPPTTIAQAVSRIAANVGNVHPIP